jgi:hypothetical protein
LGNAAPEDGRTPLLTHYTNRLFPLDPYFSGAEQEAWPRRDFLALRRDLRFGFLLHPIQAAGDPGKTLEQIERELVDKD